MKNTHIRSSCVLSLAAALAAAGAGCSSNREQKARHDASANEAEQNRLLVRLALAENVYNGVAAERAVYPKDFEPGTATLTELGTNRLDMLVYACHEGNSRVVMIRGDESDDMYEARVSRVHGALADAGLDPKQITVAKNALPSGGSETSERAILIHGRLMTSYQTGQQQLAPVGSDAGFTNGSSGK